MKEWQDTVLFWVGVIGAFLLFISPALGLGLENTPQAWTGVSSILAYVLTRKVVFKKREKTDTMDSNQNKTQGGTDGS